MSREKRYSVVYLLLAVCAAVLITCAVCASNGTQRWSNHPDYVSVEAAGQKTDNGFVRFTLTPSVRYGGSAVCFYTNHQEVHVYEGSTEIYYLMPDRTIFSASTGCVWNFVPLTRGGQETVTILLRAAYPSVEKSGLTVFCGDASAVFQNLMQESLPRLGISLCILALGIMMILYWLFLARHSGQNSLIYLGVFSLLVGLWATLETDAAALLLSSRPAASDASFLLLMLMPVPFILYTKETFHTHLSVVWRALCIESMAQTALCIVLQLTGIAPFHATAVLSHISLLLMASYLVALICRKLRQRRITALLRVQLIGAGIALIGLGADMFAYYFDVHNTDILGSVSFLIYLTLLGITAMRETIETLERGKAAEVYRQMALYDSLTDVRSRAAYDHDIAQLYHPTDKTAVVEFDLNDLKQHNDVYGHMAGDAALQQSATLIRSVFGPFGHCYRIGGDEFCVLIENSTAFHIAELAQALNTETTQRNAKRAAAGQPPLRLACGYAFFREGTDHTLEDTRRRADALMYQNKKAIKENA